jgi:hypothetical protein
MVIWPFKNKNNQRIWSVLFIVIGLLIMLVTPLSKLISTLGINSFILGLIITFAGFFYFMDVQ